LIPEFPGQTHVWMWREIVHLRGWGAEVRLYATRPPPERDRARHEFAETAARETVYLWPRGLAEIAGAIAWAVVTRPLGVIRCVRLGLRLPVEPGPAWRRVLPLLAPACIMARDALRSGVGFVHCQSAKNSVILGMMVRRLAGIPYTLVVNANLEWWGGAMHEKLGEAEFVVTHAEWIGRDIRRAYPGIPAERVLRASVGVDTRRWTPGPQRDNPGEPLRLVSVGRLHRAKRHDLLIETVGALRAEGRDVTLRIVGSGPEEAGLRALIERGALGDRVALAGSLPEDGVLNEMRRADVFVLASPAEPLGVVFMEAMACGIPVVGARGGGVGEIVSHGVDGLLVEPGSVSALVGAVRALQDDRAMRHRLGSAGRATVVGRFDSRLGAEILFKRFGGTIPGPAVRN